MAESAIQRQPIPALRPFIKLIWAADERKPQASNRMVRTDRERLLPSGAMHLVFRLNDSPIRIFDSVDDPEGETFRRGVIGGTRAGFYVKDISESGRTVGAMLQPGASKLLFGAGADEFAGRHTGVDDVWGQDANRLWEALGEVMDLDRQMNIFEQFLIRRLPRVFGVHPAIAHALSRFSSTLDIGEIVNETGYSHRRFIELFRRDVGLPPKTFTRLIRFQRTLKLFEKKSPWIDMSLEAGFSDQAHFNREFREFTGVTPSEYLLTRTGDSLHLPIGAAK